MKCEKIGKGNYILYQHRDDTLIGAEYVWDTWKNNTFSFPKICKEEDNGFRSAQLGAIYAIKSHWTVSESPATVVMPTGTGKTEVMIATVISEQCHKTCVIVPSDMLRKQTAERFCTLKKLREIGAINNAFENPVVGLLKTTPETVEELKALIDVSNVIVSTMSLISYSKFRAKYLDVLSSSCDILIIDEAHHVAAKTWAHVKSAFSNAKCLQFTATPFRNDGKKIDGDIIYSFPLALAQREGYFKPIKFYPIMQFDDNIKDLSIAKKAVEILDEDLKNNHPHLLLVRASTQKRARVLYDNVYNKYFKKYSPVLIVSDNKSENKKAFKKIDDGDAKIIVCVDMFSEGIDIPQLKICAIHDKYKSLPIMLQFVGRFARTQQNLGEASVVANIVDDDIQESLEELYSQDADWNAIIKNMSDTFIEREVQFQKFARDFSGKEIIPISYIKPKISMFMYKTNADEWHWENWNTVFDEEHCSYSVNEKEKILVITELSSSYVVWNDSKDITNETWNLYILYWNKKKNVFYINTTDKGMANKFAEAIFDEFKLVRGEEVFRCLYGINRLMLSSVGLKTAISSHHIRYRMFAGIDIAEGITNIIRGNSIKSNLFGIGYENGKKTSIGCSYKGTIWSRWVEKIDYWQKWCDEQADKILNDNIKTEDILENTLMPKVIKKRPQLIPYRIDFPTEVIDDDCELIVKTTNVRYELIYWDIGLVKFDESSPLNFYVENENVKEVFTLNIDDNGYNIEHKSGSKLSIYFRHGKTVELKDFFTDNPPQIYFVDGSLLEGNIIIKSNKMLSKLFPKECIDSWEWNGVDIKKESQTPNKLLDSIQYRVIDRLKQSEDYCIIFDDDGSGEVADVVAMKEDVDSKKIYIEFYHCKYSHGERAGARVGDLYEVCGQAEKCINWVFDTKRLFDQLLKREQKSKTNRKSSRFELGDEKMLFQLRKKLKYYTTEFSVYIVQPGVDSQKISSAMHQLLCCSQTFLQETCSIPLKLICS